MQRNNLSIIGVISLLFISSYSFGLRNADNDISTTNFYARTAPNAMQCEYYPDTTTADYIRYEDSIACAKLDEYDAVEKLELPSDEIACDSVVTNPQKKFMFLDIPLPCDYLMLTSFCTSFHDFDKWTKLSDSRCGSNGKYLGESSYIFCDYDKKMYDVNTVTIIMERKTISEIKSLYNKIISKLKAELPGVRTYNFAKRNQTGFLFVIDDDWNSPIGTILIDYQKYKNGNYYLSVLYDTEIDHKVINEMFK
jgi:hypothetical protein